MPSPNKMFYIFNFRDIRKVMQGLLMANPAIIQSNEQFLKLWQHEIFRVFYDRLMNDEDREWFVNNIIKLLCVHFKIEITKEDF